ncbi:glutamate--cysteine ligase [Pseudoalteromonas sp. MMG005]|uniref:glutamate--cysteine ligase n=1 Tax=Pseudoalteromonas sp. MMG005 TaxID=2822682 RepID=UPI001B3A3870|nr:glutamate--cysteine ligase [Pseudoalteromonas sp. MMG005]MBQ4845823.1 glutamate--cysteine ligase [Pseudoalteromonas sp. MMG005]
MITTELKTRLDTLSQPKHKHAIKGIKRGIEREALRIKASGKIAQTSHPEGAGHPLTHNSITTDFSESLLEFITPAGENAEETLAQLRDLQKFTLEHMGDELLWPMSMPCFINDENDIALAQFGNSNIGRMKTLYREGLKNRYGSMMQAIAGVHFNMSFPDSLWQSLQELHDDKQPKQAFISEQYLGLIRNFKREMWLVSYLFGASPSLCSSFLQGNDSALPFEKIGKGTLYLEHGTALRLGDLGYTNSAQSSLKVTYNNLDEYIAGLRSAIHCHSDLYGELTDYKSDNPKQLNKNILQIENEFYSPVRPKRNSESGETPSQALAKGGIEYIEIRALDVNPFADTGIDIEQIRFLDVFLTYCLLKASPEMDWDEQQLTQVNLQNVVNQGRNPDLVLKQASHTVNITKWATQIFTDLAAVAKYMDSACDTLDYSNTIAKLSAWVTDSSLTYSGRLIGLLKSEQQDAGVMALSLAHTYKAASKQQPYSVYNEQILLNEAAKSKEKEQAVSNDDQLSFSAFLDDYFAKA